MTFSPHTLAVGPTQRIERYFGTRIRVIPVTPGTFYIDVIDGVITSVETEPSVSGELIAHAASGSGASTVTVLYIAVEVDGVLAWKKASLLASVNGYTRQPERFTQ